MPCEFFKYIPRRLSTRRVLSICAAVWFTSFLLVAFGVFTGLSHGVSQPPRPQPPWVDPAIALGFLGVILGGILGLTGLAYRAFRRFFQQPGRRDRRL